MQDLFSFYKTRIAEFSHELSKIKKKLFASSMLRLVVFCMAAFGVYLFFGNTRVIMAIVLCAIILFIYLVSRHADLQYARNTLNTLIDINTTELAVLNRDFHDLPDGSGFKDPNHYYSQDIDLFGKGSFYQYVNRSSLPEGSTTLASILKGNDIIDIPKKQEAVSELAEIPKWRQDFSATASMTTSETPIFSIVNWLHKYISFVPKVMRVLPWIFTGLSVTVFILFFTDMIKESILLYWMGLGLVISGLYTKKITKLSIGASKLQSTFQQYNKLLHLIEQQDFNSAVLKNKKELITSKGRKSSEVLKEFSRLLGNLDRNNNIIYLIFGNGFFLSGLSTCYKIENWIKTHGGAVEQWFDIIAFFDAYASLGNFAFNHPEYSYPEIKDVGSVIKSRDAGHPLLDPVKSVTNDFEIGKQDFFIITGANMAGKSTFLRTVSLQILMANLGLPVCASEMEYSPIKLITSMRTTDSLTDDESYFFSELKRLRFIVDEIETDNYFIVLDEILKGTNSRDKAIGSRKFVERLVASKSTGIIATHDLSLCEVSQTLPQVKNFYFDAEIVNNELHFDYTFKKGICQNMNASFLLRKMNIILN
ncbi:MutS-related protein [Maribacter sp. CXY002]|uniref:MutS-related protein n=1 Tax=Maribacter luteocoastalis TaxID=3407671 RepID=UPI003B6811F2